MLGDLDAAEQHLRQSLRMHRALEWPVYIANSGLMLAQVELARTGTIGADASALIEEATALCDLHGFTPLAEAVDSFRRQGIA